jgi:hypothetical protein
MPMAEMRNASRGVPAATVGGDSFEDDAGDADAPADAAKATTMTMTSITPVRP